MRRKHLSFGFADLASVSTRPSGFDTTLSDSFEELAARLGFVSREPVSSLFASGAGGIDVVRFTIEVLISDRDSFVAYCRENDLTEREVFGKITTLLGK